MHDLHRKKSTASKGEIRIIGGQWRGRKLTVLTSEGLRPTPNRVKETVFNWLMPYIHGACCLDCYAGSGALGFEALSRGARSVTLLEKKKAVYQQLQKSSDSLDSDAITLMHIDALAYLNHSATTGFTIVFIDPPYGKNLVPQTVSLLEYNHWLADESWIYMETEHDHPPFTLPDTWHVHREKRTGHVVYRLFRRMK